MIWEPPGRAVMAGLVPAATLSPVSVPVPSGVMVHRSSVLAPCAAIWYPPLVLAAMAGLVPAATLWPVSVRCPAWSIRNRCPFAPVQATLEPPLVFRAAAGVVPAAMLWLVGPLT